MADERLRTLLDTEAKVIARSIAVTSNGPAFIVNSPVKAEKVKKIAVLNTISKCIKLGRTIRESKVKGVNVIREIVKHLDGFYLFKGRVKSYSLKVEGGFLIGEVLYDVIEEFKGKSLRFGLKTRT